MCGRYVSTRSPQDLAGLFDAAAPAGEQGLPPSWNVAPTDDVWAVVERADRDTGEVRRQLRAVRWGLVPSWAKSLADGAKMINARAETVHQKPAYRRAFAKRRCLVPADGFYEWRTVRPEGGSKAYKQPYFIRPEGGGVMALAGLYEFWREPQTADQEGPARWWTTCTIITTDATDPAGRVHPRMPLTIAEADFGAWLDPAVQDPDEVRALLADPGAGRLDSRPVSTAVNSVRNNGPHLLADAPPQDAGG